MILRSTSTGSSHYRSYFHRQQLSRSRMIVLQQVVQLLIVLLVAGAAVDDRSSSWGNSNDEAHHHGGIIKVGSVTYMPPYDNQQYPPLVVQVLHSYKTVFFLDIHDGADDTAYKQADWYIQLGLAHKGSITAPPTQLATEEDSYYKQNQHHSTNRPPPRIVGTSWRIDSAGVGRKTTQDSTGTRDSVSSTEQQQKHQIRYAVNALQQAVHLYQGMKLELVDHAHHHPSSLLSASRIIDHHLASTYYQIYECYSLSTDQQHATFAKDFLIRSEELYRTSVVGLGATTTSDDTHDATTAEKSHEQDSSWTDLQQYDAELGWAFCSMRLGLIWASTDSSIMLMQEGLVDSVNELDLIELLWSDPDATTRPATQDDHQNKGSSKVQQLLTGTVDRLVANMDIAESHFRNAIRILRQAIDPEHDQHNMINNHQNKQLWPSAQLQCHLAVTIQNLAAVTTMRGDIIKSIELLEEANGIYMNALPSLILQSSTQEELRDTRVAIADALYSLANSYLQLGRYRESKDRYRKAMEWHRDFDIVQPVDVMLHERMLGADDDTVAAYEDALEQYLDLVNQMTEALQYVDEVTDEASYGKDDIYEGDLHSGLGALYLARGDAVLAESHLTQALRLYEWANAKSGRNTADAKFNMALLLFRNGEFDKSADWHDEALDAYVRFTRWNGDVFVFDVQTLRSSFIPGGNNMLTDLLHRRFAFIKQQEEVGDGVNPLQDHTSYLNDVFAATASRSDPVVSNENTQASAFHGNDSIDRHKHHLVGVPEKLIDLDEYLQVTSNRTLPRDEL